MVRLSILADENLLDLLADRLITPLAIHILAPLAHLNGLLVDELCNLDSDLNSTTVSNDAVGPIIIDRLDPSVAVIATGVHRIEQFADDVPFLNCLIGPPIKKRSILPTIPSVRVQFVGDVV